MPYSTHFHKTTLLVVFLACLSKHPFVSVGLAQTGTTKAEATQREDEGRRPSEPKQPTPAHPTMVNGVPGIDLMKRLGAKFELGVSLREIDNYSNLFDRTDPNRDGQHTKEEYVDGGRYMTPQARAGIFSASDENHDGVVTRSEYVLNRIITDEGKSLIQAMDKKNGLVESMEFVETSSKRIGNQTLASVFFPCWIVIGTVPSPSPNTSAFGGSWPAKAKPLRKTVSQANANELSINAPKKTTLFSRTQTSRLKPSLRLIHSTICPHAGIKLIHPLLMKCSNDSTVTKMEGWQGTKSRASRRILSCPRT